MKSLLIWLLIASLSLNAYLLWVDSHDTKEKLNTRMEGQRSDEPVSSVVSANDYTLEELPNTNNTDGGLEQNAAQNVSPPPEGITMAFLQSLKKAQKYESLAFYVRGYLREHPQDIDALMLEAHAYYYTQPLSVALVNYYGLRDALISDAQLAEINKIIDVNTTRIIQQFSGDGSWDLLANFLEPLVQVDPLNRRYLIALAKAYGMQQQTVLMENVLASLLPNDPRAMRLRESIYQSANNETSITEDVFDVSEQTLEGEVPLIARRGQFYTQVEIAAVKAELLVDTGASTTAIAESIFNQIDIKDTSYLGTFNVQTAGGKVSSPLYRITELSLGDQSLKNIAVMVLSTENMQNFDGLLGMNVIQHFNVTLDQATGNMRMYKSK
ncbi:TIGR02281 family clan AA aspartic protease [Glaciecola siphonariae]|uniref:TIGR02281 family clan AA aspartic protease n=1 Tax=Glaciecola siphonariae TaxID=521012 RepID=A0ABV9LTC0_9ALTE